MAGFFHIGGAVTGLQSLLIDKDDLSYRGAALAVWDTARETPYMGFIIRPGGKWAGRAMAIAAFSMPLYANCKAELTARRAVANDNMATAPQAANDNEAPAFNEMGAN